jgi:hypothetical protein
MAAKNTFLIYLPALLLLCGCAPKFSPDRTHFLKDGDEVPTVELAYYKSVQERPGQDPDLAVALAISGGGARAANFGMGIMLGLEQISPGPGRNALAEVDYLSTVSGGGFAAGAYVTALYDHEYYRRPGRFELREYLPQIQADLAYSYTGVLLRANFDPRLWLSRADDGDALERAIDEQVLGAGRRRSTFGLRGPSLVLGDLFVPYDSPLPVRFPMHIANSSTLNTMHIFPFTPDILQCYQISGYRHRLRIMHDVALDPYQVPLSVGIKASGSFPVLISNTVLRSEYSAERPYLHLIDGAMTDNIGHYTALELLKQEPRERRKALLIIDADAIGNRYTFSRRGGAIFSLKVFSRLPSSGLDARRATLEKDLREACLLQGIKPVVFSFHILLHNNEAPLPEAFELKTEQRRLIGLLKKQLSLSDADKQMLYELLTNIDTKYRITPEEQELLLLGGQLIVRLMEQEVKEALGE